MDYDTWKYLNDIILEDILKYWIVFIFLWKNRGQNTFYCLFREDFNNFIYIPSFSVRVYLVLAESKIEKQFSSQIGVENYFDMGAFLTKLLSQFL